MRIMPLPTGFGAEISAFDLRDDRSDDSIAALKRAYADHHLLIFRSDQPIAPERQVEIAGWFGPIGATANADGRPWTVLSNDDPAGSDILPFHCDISFMEHPLEGLCLQPIALPGGATSTTFISNATGWDALPAALQDELRPLNGRHYFSGENSLTMRLDWPVLEHWHPLCTPHRSTGRPMLFATELHTDRIEGMDEERSAAVLQILFAALYAPNRRYEHVWQEGDILIWDNMAVQHARTRRSEPSSGPRVLQRVALGTATFLEQLDMARQRQAATLS